jgi:hypothetical protein
MTTSFYSVSNSSLIPSSDDSLNAESIVIWPMARRTPLLPLGLLKYLFFWTDFFEYELAQSLFLKYSKKHFRNWYHKEQWEYFVKILFHKHLVTPYTNLLKQMPVLECVIILWSHFLAVFSVLCWVAKCYDWNTITLDYKHYHSETIFYKYEIILTHIMNI